MEDGWKGNRGDDDFDGECVAVFQESIKNIFFFPVTKEIAVDDYFRFVRSNLEDLSARFYHGFIAENILDVFREIDLPAGIALVDRENEMEELKKDVTSINKVMGSKQDKKNVGIGPLDLRNVCEYKKPPRPRELFIKII